MATGRDLFSDSNEWLSEEVWTNYLQRKLITEGKERYGQDNKIVRDDDRSYYIGRQTLFVRDLRVDESYQAKPSEHRIQMLFGGGWNPDLGGLIQVNKRRESGHLYIMDGSHRKEGSIWLGRDTMLANVYAFPTIAMEAAFFHKLNTKRRAFLSKYVQFRALLRSGDPVTTDINNILSSYNLEVGEKSTFSYSSVQTISQLQWVYLSYGREVLDQTIDLIIFLFPSDIYRWSSPLLQTFSSFINTYPEDENFNRGRLKQSINTFSARTLATEIKEYHRAITGRQVANNGGSGRQAGIQVLLREYNRGIHDPVFGKYSRVKVKG
jgi:hypothetical protein